MIRKTLYHFFILVKGLFLSLFQKKGTMTEPIDFVVLWVDGNDPQWRKKKEECEQSINVFKKGNGNERYRDWGLFHYWFRSVERHAPWVRNVYLVTCGQVPEWLNTQHPKLRLVNHEDFMDEKDLPTFNSPAIEIHLHRIKGLSEYFVYFNDDIFLTRDVAPEDFFQDNKPLVCAAGYPVRNNPIDALWNHMQFSIMGLANKYDWERTIMTIPEKWFNVRYGSFLRFNWRMLQDSYMSGIHDIHLASPFLKSTFENTWAAFGDALACTATHKFRTHTDISQNLFKIQNIHDGNFVPCSYRHFGAYYYLLSHFYKSIAQDIKKHRHKMVCINDSWDVTDDNFETIKEAFNEAFNNILPEKSSFEK